jgi:hypothetical protein
MISKNLRRLAVLLTVLSVPAGAAMAADAIVPNAFTPGTPIRAADVNANFQALKTAGNSTSADVVGLTGRVTALEAPKPVKVGAYTVGAVDFQPTITGSTGVVRAYDAFGADTANSKIGAAIHPPDGAIPTRLSCFYTSPGIALSNSNKVTATLWKVSTTTGSQPMASLDMPELFNAPTTPLYTSTTVFTGGPFQNMVGNDIHRYLVELEFIGVTFADMKIWGCTIEYTVAP